MVVYEHNKENHEQSKPRFYFPLTCVEIVRRVINSSVYFSGRHLSLREDESSGFKCCMKCKKKSLNYFFSKRFYKRGDVNILCGDSEMITQTLIAFHNCLYLISKNNILGNIIIINRHLIFTYSLY